MKKSLLLLLITGLSLLLFQSTGYGQAEYTNTSNTISFTNFVGDCSGSLPPTNTYAFSIRYFDLSTGNTVTFPTTGTVNVSVTSDANAKTMSISVPGANLPSPLSQATVTLSGSASYDFFLDLGQVICVPLPITLSAFTAHRNTNNTVTVAWTTQLETMVSIFIIERSPDGKHWSQIGTQAPTNGGSITTNYTFIDNNPFKNDNFYRLKSVDFDGKFTFSPVAYVSCPLCTLLPPPPPPPPSCASLGITGVDYLCSSTPGTISLTNLPAGTYVNWYADASSMVNLTQGGASTSVTKVGNGLVYILADVSGCSQGPITIHKQIQLGTALHINYNITSAPPPNKYKQLVASVDFVPGTTGSSYHWTLNLGAKGTTTYTGQGMSASLPPCSGGTLTVVVNTPCGTAQDGVTVYNTNCGPNFAMAPNPARRSLTITTVETADGTNNLNPEQLTNRSLLPDNATSYNQALERRINHSLTSTSMGSITKIQLYNKTGLLVFEKEFSTGQKMVNISLPNLAPDMYIIHIYNKTEKEVKQLLILQ